MSTPTENQNSPSLAIEIPLIHTEDGQTNSTLNLSKFLSRLETFLTLFGYCQSSFVSLVLSWISFLLLGIVLPVFLIKLSASAKFDKYQINTFEFQILVFQSLSAAISLLCISHNLRKYGVRNFLFVDRFHGHSKEFHQDYADKIYEFFKLLAIWVSPCLFLKIAREVFRLIYVHHDPLWESAAILTGLIVSWTYSTIIYLSGCALFNLLCNLQVVHFDNYGKLLEKDMDVLVYIEEHIRLTHHLSKISHRFRIFFIFELLVVTASQIVALFQTTGNKTIINLVNGGDFLISSVAELVGLIICLHAAAKTTHRAQGVSSVASKWHALVTCTSSNSNTDLEAPSTGGPLRASYSQSDLQSVDYVPLPTNSQLSSSSQSFNMRQSFVAYLQSNAGGFSVFGWMIDRPLINTIFFLEISFVMFVLGKTLIYTPN
ncbi:uncharacterized protein LOC126672990 [Mercurialis annua]|uniref:uncharacterized protein LOC126672990 n=1 Tax=Mercurialis annua TaxID=3986 RepID=UPI00215E1718|nr:uncharacterized protein LOC126672990 [Mercurialis annua]